MGPPWASVRNYQTDFRGGGVRPRLRPRPMPRCGQRTLKCTAALEMYLGLFCTDLALSVGQAMMDDDDDDDDDDLRR
jgi:hypothetical protein